MIIPRDSPQLATEKNNLRYILISYQVGFTSRLSPNKMVINQPKGIPELPHRCREPPPKSSSVRSVPRRSVGFVPEKWWETPRNRHEICWFLVFPIENGAFFMPSRYCNHRKLGWFTKISWLNQWKAHGNALKRHRIQWPDSECHRDREWKPTIVGMWEKHCHVYHIHDWEW